MRAHAGFTGGHLGTRKHRNKYGGGQFGRAGERMCVIFARNALSAFVIIGVATETKPLAKYDRWCPLETGLH